MKILLLIEQLAPCSVVPFAMFLHPHSCRQMWRWQSWLWVCIVRSNWVETRLPADRWPSESQNFGIEAPPHLTDYPTQARITCTWTSNDHRSDVFQQWLVTSSVIFDYARSYNAQPNWKGLWLIWKVNRYPNLKFFCSRFVTVPAESDVCFANRVDAPCPVGGHSDNWQKDTNANKNTAFYSVVMDCELLVNLPFCHLSETHFFPVSNSNPALFSNRLVLWQ